MIKWTKFEQGETDKNEGWNEVVIPVKIIKHMIPFDVSMINHHDETKVSNEAKNAVKEYWLRNIFHVCQEEYKHKHVFLRKFMGWD